ncbi:nuclear transport factor 2 family protein [Haloactinopolyspora sp.]|uniref:nuclear transport factor 2 family protein n=1 Tax=Haloactinopolyspora sp. TaxID=1966353 RepID=UPI002610FD1D|nr:nuclear transport factor 2 family protein [Haloactinopolyspora sp.]
MAKTAEIVTTYWNAADARDWDTFATTLADDVVYTLPQTRERIRGKSAYVQFNAEYPGAWRLTVQRLVAVGDEAASWVDFRVGDEQMIGVTFFRLVDGKIVDVTDVWPEPYEPPPGREHLVERY